MCGNAANSIYRGGIAGKDVYSFEKKYNQGNLVEKIDIVIENGVYNVGHYISDEKDRLLLNEKIYGIHLYLPDNKHVFIPIKFKIYQGYDTGASLDSQGGGHDYPNNPTPCEFRSFF
ncbi:TPA: PsaF/MyfF family fimbrial adhesin regulatory protein [Escherichia coli]